MCVRASVAAAQSEMGDRGRAQLGLTTGSVTIQGGWSGALNRDAVPIQDHSISRANLGVQYHGLSQLTLGAYADTPLQGEALPAFSLGVSGSLLGVLIDS